ncbi:hypothetical protein VKT23_013367 [Stygiomarasmius scandens]|uniref:Copper radical oxidase n=1 Tax=Marasmiellus scandens TaxID=2682957 RepID=A0ABR1J6K3_9AGAR
MLKLLKLLLLLANLRRSALVFADSTATEPLQLENHTFVSGAWGLTQPGRTGVSAMQLAIVSESTAIILDKIENNPGFNNARGQPAWASELDLITNQARPLNPVTDTFCATGSFLGNGTFVSTGGTGDSSSPGFQGIRMFTPCTDKTCDIFENPSSHHLTSNRWYPSSVRLDDGSVMIYGGSTSGAFQNSEGINNPSYELFPPKNINGFNGVQIPSQFLKDTLNGNHFPILIMLPDGNIFIAANQKAMVFNWRDNTEVRRLPDIPNGVRIRFSPYSAGAVLLPLTPENNYTPEVMICGGSTVSDTVNPASLSSQTPASAQCSRMVLTEPGIAAGWKIETMPQPRVMPELILLPDERILIINGAQTGVAGYGNVGDQIGSSNADHPAFSPVLYNPNAPAGSRFSATNISSTIPRIYHSTASLTPNGTILVAGCNPNAGVQTRKYQTEYRFEYFSPPYMLQSRPTYTGLPATVDYNAVFELSVDFPFDLLDITPSVVLIDLGFATHGVHMDQRLVKLESVLSLDRKTLTVTGPPSPRHYPPGPAYLYIVTGKGVPSFGHKTLIGTGATPPVDEGAIANLLRTTASKIASVPENLRPMTGEGSEDI